MKAPRVFSSSVVAAIACATAMAACGDNAISNALPLPVVQTTVVSQTNLIADVSGAPVIDPSLVNPWGLAFGPTGILWVANNGTGTSTTYDAAGNKQSLTVNIPMAGLAVNPLTGVMGGGTPTGTVFNSSNTFDIGTTGPALFLFASEDGLITGWNAASGTQASVLIDRSANGAVYKGITIALNAGANFIYAADFKNNAVEVFNGLFQMVNTFTDPSLPAGYAPFGIQNLNGRLFVSYAKQLGPDNHDDSPGVGNGFVVVFNLDGTIAQHFAANGSLNSPWGMAIAPAGFGTLSGDILVGNFGDGHVGVYDPSGVFVTMLKDASGNLITIDGLWSLTAGPSSAASSIYFSAGPNAEAHGLVGTLSATIH